MLQWLKGGTHRRRRIAASAGTLGLVAAIAFAAWLADGTGPARGKTGSLQALTVTAGFPPSGTGCFPGGDCAGQFNVSNPNGALTIVTIVGDDDVGPTSSPDNTCATYLSVNPQSSLSIPLPNGVTSGIEVPNLFHLAAAAPTNCQSQNFTRGVKVSAATGP